MRGPSAISNNRERAQYTSGLMPGMAQSTFLEGIREEAHAMDLHVQGSVDDNIATQATSRLARFTHGILTSWQHTV